MNKYLSIFKISFQQEIAYRLNFIMWRVRNILQIFLVFFLWDTVFSSPGQVVFGYDRAKILTYVFGLLIMKSLVTSTGTIDIAGEISQGTLSNYLLKPISYFKYWFARDLSSKSINMIFAVFEFMILWVLLKPPIFLQTNIPLFFFFILSTGLAILLFFIIMIIFNLFPLWYPEQAWGLVFLLLIFVDFLGGGIFPLDILPEIVQRIIYATPFPYLLFVPLQIYLGKFSIDLAFRGVLISSFWVGILTVILVNMWNLGLKAYRSEGR